MRKKKYALFKVKFLYFFNKATLGATCNLLSDFTKFSYWSSCTTQSESITGEAPLLPPSTPVPATQINSSFFTFKVKRMVP
jgi:hypothetical protein